MSEGLSRKDIVLYHLNQQGYDGTTVAELRHLFPEEEGTKDHHGSWSGVMSNLHRDGRIDRLQEQRDGSEVYVLPEFVEGRDTKPQGRKPTELEMLLAYWMEPEKETDREPRARKYPAMFVSEVRRTWERYCPPGSQLWYRIKIEKVGK